MQRSHFIIAGILFLIPGISLAEHGGNMQGGQQQNGQQSQYPQIQSPQIPKSTVSEKTEALNKSAADIRKSQDQAYQSFTQNIAQGSKVNYGDTSSKITEPDLLKDFKAVAPSSSTGDSGADAVADIIAAQKDIANSYASIKQIEAASVVSQAQALQAAEESTVSLNYQKLNLLSQNPARQNPLGAALQATSGNVNPDLANTPTSPKHGLGGSMGVTSSNGLGSVQRGIAERAYNAPDIFSR